jgi:hypothetical protein
MAGIVELDIAGLEGNMMAQPRLFAHDAVGFAPADYDKLLVPLPAVDPVTGLDQTVLMQRGACLYIGVAVTTLTVTMESGNDATFLNIAAGSFLPILVTKIQEALTAPLTPVASGDIVILW